MHGARRAFCTGVLAAATVAAVGVAGAGEPRRDPNGYFILGMRSVRLNKGFVFDQHTAACNVGVNCRNPAPGSDIGTLLADTPLRMGYDTQLVADSTGVKCSAAFTADVFEVFANRGSVYGASCVAFHGPTSGPRPFTAPILGAGSCSDAGVPNPAAMAAACGFPSPFPGCGGPDIVCAPGSECTATPGTYGKVVVKDGAKLTLAPGTYNVCSFSVGRLSMCLSSGATVNVDGGTLQLGNGSIVGAECGDLRFFAAGGTAEVQLGKNARVTASICAPERELRLGDSNTLTGNFWGDRILMDKNNEGRCCPTCVCFDSFTPVRGAAGSTLTLVGHCDLRGTTAVTFRCNGVDHPALIQSKTNSQVQVQVPVIPVGSACTVIAHSGPGKFVHDGTFTVVP